MALTGTDRGTGGNTTAATSLAVVPGSTIPAGDMAVLVVAYDNAGSGGSDPYSSISDSAGNTWTSRQNSLNDPGAASAGVAFRIFTSLLTTQLTTGSTITVSFGSTSVTAKAWTLSSVNGGAGTPTYVTGGQATGSSTTPSVTSGSIASGDMIVGAFGAEAGTTQTLTGDSDTTNGSWSTAQYAEFGSTTSGMTAGSQRKVVSAAGAQTFNVTLGISSDWAAAWISIDEVGSVTHDATGTATGTGTLAGAAVTPTTVNFACGIEDALLSTHWGIVGTASIDSTVAGRTAANAARVDVPNSTTIAYINTSFTASGAVVLKARLRLSAFPTSDTTLVSFNGVSFYNGSLWIDGTTHALGFNIGGTDAIGPVIATDTWYVIDLVIDGAGKVGHWMVDGVAQSDPGSPANAETYNNAFFGKRDAITTGAYSVYVDDVVISKIATDYPIPPGVVVGSPEAFAITKSVTGSAAGAGTATGSATIVTGGGTLAATGSAAGAGTASGTATLRLGASGSAAGAGTMTGVVGTTYYISPTGNDTTGNGSFATPWRTLSKLYSMLTAGGTGLCRGGSYTGNNGDCGIVVTSTGTASAPIIVKAYPGETPVFDGTGATITTQNYNLQFKAGAAYHELRGLTFQNWAWNPSRGSNGSANVIMDQTGGTLGDVNHITIDGNTFVCGVATPNLNDWMVYVGGACQYITITNNRITGGGTVAGTPDYSDFGGGVQMFHVPVSDQIVVDHNLIGYCRFAINIGDVFTNITITHNTVHHSYLASFAQYGNIVLVRDNVADTLTGTSIFDEDDGSPPTNYTHDHNYAGQTLTGADFDLTAGSPAINGALDGSDAGWKDYVAGTTHSATGSASGTGAASGTAALRLGATGSAAGAGTASLSGTLRLGATASAAGAGTATGAATATYSASGSPAGSGAATGSASLRLAVSGSAAGAGQASATTGAILPATGTASGTGQASASPYLVTPATGSATGTGQAAASAVMRWALSGTAAGAGQATAGPGYLFSVSGTAAGAGQTTGTAKLVLAATATANGIGTVTGSGALRMALSGTATGTGQATATTGAISPVTGSASGTGSASATPFLTLGASASATGTGSATASGSMFRGATGSATGVLNGTGALVLRLGVSGSGAGSGAAQGDSRLILRVTGGAAGWGSADGAVTVLPPFFPFGPGVHAGVTPKGLSATVAINRTPVRVAGVSGSVTSR